MRGLVIGGSAGYCFSENSASLNSKAGSKTPRKDCLIIPSLQIKQIPIGAGLLPFLIFHSACSTRALLRCIVRNYVGL